jgi:hypothetical protein
MYFSRRPVKEGFSANKCKKSPISVGMDYGGGDYRQDLMPSGSTAEMCQTKCCKEEKCLAFTFAPSCPFDMGGCKKGQPCCFLKNSVTYLTPNKIVSSGSVSHIKSVKKQIKQVPQSIPALDKGVVKSIKESLIKIIKERPEIVQAVKEIWQDETIQNGVKKITLKNNELDKNFKRLHDNKLVGINNK